jgi:hypothetical protein
MPERPAPNESLPRFPPALRVPQAGLGPNSIAEQRPLKKGKLLKLSTIIKVLFVPVLGKAAFALRSNFANFYLNPFPERIRR